MVVSFGCPLIYQNAFCRIWHQQTNYGLRLSRYHRAVPSTSLDKSAAKGYLINPDYIIFLQQYSI